MSNISSYLPSFFMMALLGVGLNYMLGLTGVEWGQLYYLHCTFGMAALLWFAVGYVRHHILKTKTNWRQVTIWDMAAVSQFVSYVFLTLWVL